MQSALTYVCHKNAWRQHQAELRSFLAHRTGSASEADDLLQEVFLKALHQGEDFCSLENARAWLFQVARNTLIDGARAIHPTKPLPHGDD